MARTLGGKKRKEKKTWTEMRFSLYTESPGTMLLVSRASSLDFAIKTPSCLCGIITALFPPLIPPRWLAPPRPPPRPRPRTPKPLPALFCALKAPPPRPPLPALFWALKAPRPWPAPCPNISITNAEGKKQKKLSSYVLIILKLWQCTNLCVG